MTEHAVVIAGGGPTGLMLAGELALASVDVAIVERRANQEPKTYVKTAESGAKRIHAFCFNCGTPIYACVNIDDPPSYSLRVGCLTQRAQLPPKKRIWCKSALEWAQDVSGVPAMERQ